MSTVVVKNITNGADTTSVENVYRGGARAWVNFNGTGTVSIRSSFNVSSITDVGIGNYQINFINKMSNNIYAVFTSLGRNSIAGQTTNTTHSQVVVDQITYLTTSFRIGTTYTANGVVTTGVYWDPNIVTAVVFSNEGN